MSLRTPRKTDEFNISLLESYKRRRIAIANMPELPPSPPPQYYGGSTSSEREDARTHRVGHLRGRAVQAFEAAKGNPADGRWGVLSDVLRLSCTAGREGRWIGVRVGLGAGEDEQQEEVDEALEQLDFILAKTEKEWTAWEARYEMRLNLMRRVGKWKRGVEVDEREGEEMLDSLEGEKTRQGTRPRKGSPLRVVTASAGDHESEPEAPLEEEVEQEEAEVEPAPPAAVAPSTPTPKAKRRVARMSTGGKSPRRAKTVLDEPTPTASTSGAGAAKVVNVVSTVPDALKSGAPFGFGVVKRASATATATAKGKGKGKEKARATDADADVDAPPTKRNSKEKDLRDDERTRRVKEAEELKSSKKQERVEWERARERRLKEAREKERVEEEARRQKEKEKEVAAERRRQQQEEEDADADEEIPREAKGKETVNNVRQMQIQDVSEMSFLPPSFPSSAVVHSTPKPLARPTRPFGLRSNTSESIHRADETTRNRIKDSLKDKAKEKDPVEEEPVAAAEESSYSLGISMATSADLPSQIVFPIPPARTAATATTQKRVRPVSPTPSPVVRSERPPEKKARKDDARDEESIEIVDDMSFIPPSFPQGGIVTSTPKPPSKSKVAEAAGPKPREFTPPPAITDVVDLSFVPPSFPPGGIITSTPKLKSAPPSEAPATASPKQRETTPPSPPARTIAPKPTRAFLLPPTPKSTALEASSSLPAIPSHPPTSPTANKTRKANANANKRPASPSTHVRENALKKARTMPLVSPPSSPMFTPTRASPAKAQARAEDLVSARTTLLNVRHLLPDQGRASQQAATAGGENGGAGVDAGDGLVLPVTPQKKTRGALPTLTDLLASARKGTASPASASGSAKRKVKKKTLIVRTPSGERVDVMAARSVRPMLRAKAQVKEPGMKEGMDGVQDNGLVAVGEERHMEQEEESLREPAEPSTIGTGVENYQQLKAAANASMDIFFDESDAANTRSEPSPPTTSPAAPSPPPPAAPTDPYSDAYHFTEDIIVPTGSKLRTFPGAGGSYPFIGSQDHVDPYADNPYDDPYASAGEHVGISPTKSLSSLAGSDSDSDGAADDSDDGGFGPAYGRLRVEAANGDGRSTGAFGAGLFSPGFVFDPRAASTQVPPGLSFGVSTGTGAAGSLFSAAAPSGTGSTEKGAAENAKPASQESKDSWASMYASSAPAERATSSSVPAPSSSMDPVNEPSSQYALPNGLQPVLSSSPPVQMERDSSPVRAPPSSSNPLFTFSSQALGSNLAKHVDMVSKLLDKDVDFSGWLKDPEEIDEPTRGVEESP